MSARRRAALRIWAVVKTTTWERDRGRCRHCAAPATDPHHLKYRSAGGAHETSNTVWLCRRCHDAVHALQLLVWFTDANDLLDGVTFIWRPAWDGLERPGQRHAAGKTAGTGDAEDGA